MNDVRRCNGVLVRHRGPPICFVRPVNIFLMFIAVQKKVLLISSLFCSDWRNFYDLKLSR